MKTELQRRANLTDAVEALFRSHPDEWISMHQLAAVGGLVIALPASGGPLRPLARLLLNALRSVPELVWAALLLISAGGQVVRTDVKTVNRYSSGARGVIVMRLKDGDSVAGIAARTGRAGPSVAT